MAPVEYRPFLEIVFDEFRGEFCPTGTIEKSQLKLVRRLSVAVAVLY
jgi:hypothetical protein